MNEFFRKLDIEINMFLCYLPKLKSVQPVSKLGRVKINVAVAMMPEGGNWSMRSGVINEFRVSAGHPGGWVQVSYK